MESVTARPTLKLRTIWILAIAITALDFIVMAVTADMSYLTSDDGSIQNALSGYLTGSPFTVQQYVNVIISFPIAGLYRLFPGIQWWYVWSMILVAVGIFLVHFCFLKLSSKNRIFLPVVFGILIFLDIGFFLYPIANIAFTIVPVIFGSGIVACLFLRAEADEVRHEKWAFAGSLVGYVLLFCHRRMAGLVMLCFILLAFLYYYVSRNTNWKRTLLKFLITVAVFLAASWTLTYVNSTVQNRYQAEGFSEFNSARSQFMDYPHDSYDENPELYEEVGWDRDVYMLADAWCFIPEEVTAENMRYISNHSEYTTAQTSQKALLKELYSDRQDRAVLMLYLASIIIAVTALILCRNRKKNLVFLLLNNLGAIFLLTYQILEGRALYRSIMVVLIPAVVINIMLSVNRPIERKISRTLFGLVVLAMGVICVYPMLSTTFNQSRKAYVEEMKEQYRIVRDYMLEHPDNFYILQTGISSNIDPANLPDGPYNGCSWGGGSSHSAIYNTVLEENGIDEINGETLKENRVYFIAKADAMDESFCDNGNNLFAALLRYLEKEYGACGFVQEDVVKDGVYVYHFVYEDNAEDYDTYYDIVEGYTVEVK